VESAHGSGNAVISISGLSKICNPGGGGTALTDIDLDIRREWVFALLVPNGSQKNQINRHCLRKHEADLL